LASSTAVVSSVFSAGRASSAGSAGSAELVDSASATSGCESFSSLGCVGRSVVETFRLGTAVVAPDLTIAGSEVVEDLWLRNVMFVDRSIGGRGNTYGCWGVDAKMLKKYGESGMSKLELGSCQGTDLIGGKHNAVRKDWRRRYKRLVYRRKKRERNGAIKREPRCGGECDA